MVLLMLIVMLYLKKNSLTILPNCTIAHYVRDALIAQDSAQPHSCILEYVL